MQLIDRIRDSLLPEFKRAARKSLSRYRFKGRKSWLLALSAIAALGLWNIKLLVATSTGVLVMLGVYLMHEWDWHVLGAKLRKVFSGSNRHLTLAVSSGSFATLSTYVAVSVWAESENHWMAVAVILQDLSTIAVLVLLAWQVFNRPTKSNDSNFNALVADLANADSLKRLIAVRQLTRLVKGDRTDSTNRRASLDYFRLMLAREPETLIRDALLDGIQALDAPKQLSSSAQPLSIPQVKKRVSAPARQSIS